MTPEFNVGRNSFPVGVAPRRGLHASDYSVMMERDCLLEDLNRYKIENEHLMKLMSEKDAVMKAMSTRLVYMEKKAATMEAVKVLTPGSYAELPSFATRKMGKDVRTKNSLTEAILSKYLKFAFPVENADLTYCCRKARAGSFYFRFTMKQAEAWRERTKFGRVARRQNYFFSGWPIPLVSLALTIHSLYPKRSAGAVRDFGT